MSILLLINFKITILTLPKTKECSFGIRSKICIFLYEMGKVKENKTLIYLSERKLKFSILK